MRLIITGCEYVGKTTLVHRIGEWKHHVLGPSIPLVWYGKHAMPVFQDHDHILVGYHIEETIYAPFYYGYNEDGSYPSLARLIDTELMKQAPDTILIHVKVSPEVIATRLRTNPHPRGVLQEQDIEYVLARFEEEVFNSSIRYKFALDTSSATVDETMAEFERQISPYLQEADRLRMLTHRAATQDG